MPGYEVGVTTGLLPLYLHYPGRGRNRKISMPGYEVGVTTGLLPLYLHYPGRGRNRKIHKYLHTII